VHEKSQPSAARITRQAASQQAERFTNSNGYARA